MKKIYFFELFNRIVKSYKIKQLKKHGSKIGKVVVHGNFHIEGRYVHINQGVVIQASNKIIIGNNVHLSYDSKLITCNLDIKTQKHICKPIVIKDNVWVGANAIILGGVTVGENCIIGAGAIVTKDVLPNSVVAGIPAKKIKDITK
jgi:acetyltransferase-like isoleucine patch superfamily enzyme